MEACKHMRERGYEEGLCAFCKANRKAAYDLTGTHDPKKQKEYWNGVWEHLQKLRRDKFKKKLQGQ